MSVRLMKMASGGLRIDIPFTGLLIGTRLASVNFMADGVQRTIINTGGEAETIDQGLWGPGGSAYEIRATLVAGPTPTVNAGLNSWLSLDSNRLWNNFRYTPGAIASTLLFEIQPAGSGSVLASGEITLRVEL